MRDVRRGWTVKNVMAGNRRNIIQLFIARISDLIAARKINQIVLLHPKGLDRKPKRLMQAIKRNPRFY